MQDYCTNLPAYQFVTKLTLQWMIWPQYGLERWLKIDYWEQEWCTICRPKMLGSHMMQRVRMDLQVEWTSCWLGDRNCTDVYCSFSYTPQPGELLVDLFFWMPKWIKMLDKNTCVTGNQKSNYILKLVTCLLTSWLDCWSAIVGSKVMKGVLFHFW